MMGSYWKSTGFRSRTEVGVIKGIPATLALKWTLEVGQVD